MAITEGAICAVSGADGSATSITSTSFDSTGGGLLLFFVGHEGASTTYTWSDNKGTASGNFLNLGTINAATGAGAGDMSLNAVAVWSPTVGTGHTVTVTFGASRPFRRIAGVVVNGSFSSASILAATTQTAEQANGTAVDAGSLVTDAAAYLFHCGINYNGVVIGTPGTGWTTKTEDGSGGRHFQARIEAASGTFDPAYTLATPANEITLAAALKEVAGAPAGRQHLKFNLLGVG